MVDVNYSFNNLKLCLPEKYILKKKICLSLLLMINIFSFGTTKTPNMCSALVLYNDI